MRMWNIDPSTMCRSHLLGEHLEMHMFIGSINTGKSISGFIKNGLVNPKEIKTRHDSLALEMLKRGYSHNSPIEFNCENLPDGYVDVEKNKQLLHSRCYTCFINSIK
jgi:hypothetical protein